MFLSLVRPDRISSPMTRTAAVTISGDALWLAVMASFRSFRTPSVAPSVTQAPMAVVRSGPMVPSPPKNWAALEHASRSGLRNGQFTRQFLGLKLAQWLLAVSYTHLRAHETDSYL